ncbi:hypothetical protein VP5_048 [Vibrio virus VPMCC5]|nr:hypothetical protein VP5_048 [Vibrio virus VPMCC5]
MKVSKELLQDYASEGEYIHKPFELILEEDVDERRWVKVVRQVLQHAETGKFYETFYERGLTECQETEPYEYEPDEIELDEVVPVIVKRTVYDKVA